MKIVINKNLLKNPRILWLDEKSFIHLAILFIALFSLMSIAFALGVRNYYVSIAIPVIMIAAYRGLRVIEKKHSSSHLFKVYVYYFLQRRKIKVENFTKNVKIK